MRYENILDAIGNTPLIRLNRLTEGLECKVYVKAEFFNPGGSVKDRIATSMIDEAEREGWLKPGGTIIEGTSGNTGIGLALVAAVRGYKLIFTITDKQSREKINFLKALGAEVIVCPTNVEPDDPRSYYSIAKKLAKEIPGAYYPNQYDNQKNPEAHVKSTGPELWKDTGGKITHFVAGAGTGGTLSGTGKFLKSKNKKIKVIAADPVGSIYKEFFETGKMGQAKPYVVEGIGEDIIPTTMHFKYVDEVVEVTDKESFLMTRKLANREGIFTGGSGGSAMAVGLKIARKLKKSDFMVVLLPDTGMRYLSKIYNEEWMKENRYFESELHIQAQEILRLKLGRTKRKMVTAGPKDELLKCLKKMRELDISQMPVFDGSKLIGTVREDDVMRLMLDGGGVKNKTVREVMAAPLPVVGPQTRVDMIVEMMSGKDSAVLVKHGRDFRILTKYDVLNAMAKAAGRN